MEQLLLFVCFYINLVTGIPNCEVILSASTTDLIDEEQPLTLTCFITLNVDQIEWTIDGYTVTLNETQCGNTCMFNIPGLDVDHNFIFNSINTITMSYFNIASVPLSINGTVVSCAAKSSICPSSSQNYTFMVRKKVNDTTVKHTSKATVQTSTFLNQGTILYPNKTSSGSTMLPHIKLSTATSKLPKTLELLSLSTQASDVKTGAIVKETTTEYIETDNNKTTLSKDLTTNHTSKNYTHPTSYHTVYSTVKAKITDDVNVLRDISISTSQVAYEEITTRVVGTMSLENHTATSPWSHEENKAVYTTAEALKSLPDTVMITDNTEKFVNSKGSRDTTMETTTIQPTTHETTYSTTHVKTTDGMYALTNLSMSISQAAYEDRTTTVMSRPSRRKHETTTYEDIAAVTNEFATNAITNTMHLIGSTINSTASTRNDTNTKQIFNSYLTTLNITKSTLYYSSDLLTNTAGPNDGTFATDTPLRKEQETKIDDDVTTINHKVDAFHSKAPSSTASADHFSQSKSSDFISSTISNIISDADISYATTEEMKTFQNTVLPDTSETLSNVKRSYKTKIKETTAQPTRHETTNITINLETNNNTHAFKNNSLTTSRFGFKETTTKYLSPSGLGGGTTYNTADMTKSINGTIKHFNKNTSVEKTTQHREKEDDNYKITTGPDFQVITSSDPSNSLQDSTSFKLTTSTGINIQNTKEQANGKTDRTTNLARKASKVFATGVSKDYHVSQFSVVPSTSANLSGNKQVFCTNNIDSRGTVWNVTVAGTTVSFPCSNIDAELSGNIYRECKASGTWIIPKYDCVHKDIKNLEGLLGSSSTDAMTNTILDTLATLTTPGEGSGSLYSGDIESITNVLEDIANNQNLKVTDDQAKTFLTTVGNILDSSTRDVWKEINQNNRDTKEASSALRLLNVFDTYVDAFANSLPETRDNKTFSVSNILLQVRRVNNFTSIAFPEGDIGGNGQKSKSRSSLSISQDSLKGSTIFAAVLYENLLGILPIKASFDKATLDSSVITAKLNNWKANTNFKITIVFERLKINSSKAICSFRNENSVLWENEGCYMVSSNSTTIVCECNHLTNFAILMSPWTEDNVQDPALDYITIICCSVSSLCLVLTMVMHFIFWRRVKTKRVKILMNLCVALVISYVTFLVGVDRTEDEKGCAAVAALLHYIYLVVFSFMLAEGIEIFFALVYVFSNKHKTKWIIPVAWLLPAVIVGISLAVTRIHGYGDKNKCWLSFDKGLIWAFVGPATVIILINCVILGCAMRAVFRVQMVRNQHKLDKAKTGIRSLCVLLPLVGCTWISGIFYVNKSMAWIQYIFAICNGLQGLVIFIFHCALNKQIMKALVAVVNRNNKKKECLTLRTSNEGLYSRLSIKRDSKTSPTPHLELFPSSSNSIGGSEVSLDYSAKIDNLQYEELNKIQIESEHDLQIGSLTENQWFTHM
ncbi:uncharacterized protein LOC132758398 isoform X2 [Ruditapes philippinarum]|uniref:uncharacterized protein LOC132758398 isoform X2 n=1 Tax=Ruditapes philippinarum TaxID=129788 RepID=UPI00295B1577|nr:uncharacterized protein LOC132758398 isoform X2 [Ruditapes philippinarum]